MREIKPEDLLGPLNEVEAANAPRSLFVAGDESIFDLAPRVSVVGTRKPTADAVKRTRFLCRALVGRGMVVVSGLAEGIDTAAHRQAIEVGGRTVAVVGNGLDIYFPSGNRGLQEEIACRHIAISQFPPGTPPRRGQFPQRNRTMALVSDATVIVEAGESSGTLHQGWEALRLGRPLFLMESLAKRDDLHWPAEMIHYGAQILTRDSLEHVLDAMPSRSREPLSF